MTKVKRSATQLPLNRVVTSRTGWQTTIKWKSPSLPVLLSSVIPTVDGTNFLTSCVDILMIELYMTPIVNTVDLTLNQETFGQD